MILKLLFSGRKTMESCFKSQVYLRHKVFLSNSSFAPWKHIFTRIPGSMNLEEDQNLPDYNNSDYIGFRILPSYKSYKNPFFRQARCLQVSVESGRWKIKPHVPGLFLARVKRLISCCLKAAHISSTFGSLTSTVLLQLSDSLICFFFFPVDTLSWPLHELLVMTARE